MVRKPLRRPVAVLAVVVLALVAAACGRQAAPPPVMGAAATGAPPGLAAWLESVAPSQRLEWRDLETACAGQADCRRDLDRLAAALRATCPRRERCADPVALLLYVERTAAQRVSGLYPGALPRAAEVLAAWEAAAPTATPGR